MDYYEYRHKASGSALRTCWYMFIGIIVALFICALFSGCDSTQYIPIETVRTEYSHKTDTVKQTDSVFHEKETIIREADSAMIAKLGLQLKANERAILVLQKELEKQVNSKSESKTDTVFRNDSVQVPYPVERQLSHWEQFCIDYGKVMTGATVVLLVFIIVWLARRLRKSS